ncbi:MAG: S-layer protein [Deltaproteobacteria bacterium]|nr:S-layer protein [Nannocystaceae bacterium]
MAAWTLVLAACGSGSASDVGGGETDESSSADGATVDASSGPSTVSASGPSSSASTADASTQTATDDGSSSASDESETGSTGTASEACGDAPEIPYAVDFSTYLGGAADWEHARDVFIEPSGDLVVVGGTASDDFPATAGAYDMSFNAGGGQIGAHGESDVFVAKFGADGTLQWATYLGGPNYDRAYSVELDAAGDVYVSGRAGPGFPTSEGVFQPEYAGNDSGFYGEQNGFIAKLSGDGGALIWASYVGVSHLVRDFDIDDAGNAYVVLPHQVGSSAQTPGWFDTAFDDAYQPTRTDAEESGVAKISADGSEVLWASWFGGQGVESSIGSLRIDDEERPYLALYTTSSDLPTTGGQGYGGGEDVFVARFSADGSQLEMGAYLGGSGDDAFETHALGLGDGHVYLAGFTDSKNFPTTAGAFQTGYGGGNLDAFAAKLDLSGNLVAATYVGGGGVESTDGLTVTLAGEVLFSGETNSDDLPTSTTAFQPARGGDWDAFAIRLGPDLDVLRYGSYFGGPAHDNGRGAVLGEDCAMFLVGASAGAGFPTSNAWQPGFAGGGEQWGNGDAFVVALSPGG